MELVARLRILRPVTGRCARLIMPVLALVILLSGTCAPAAERGRSAQGDRRTSRGSRPGQARPESREMSAKELDAAMEQRVRTLKRGTSQRSARKMALTALPLDKMTPANRQKAERVISSLSLFRELPTLSVEVNPQIYRFFVQHPDVAVSIWRVMQISRFEMWQTSRNEYEADAGDGTVGVIDVLHRSDNDNVIYCEGEYKSPLLRKAIRGKAVLHLQTSFSQRPNGKNSITHRLYMYVAFPSQSIETVAKVMSPVSNMIVDRNFREISLFLNMMTMAMTRQPGWVETVATRMEGVVKGRKSQLLKLTEQVYQTHQEQQLAARAENNLSKNSIPSSSSRKVIRTAGNPVSNE